MKIAISCDYLLERNHYTEIVELVCEMFPEAKVYCFAHRPGAILGSVEQRSISSTYLSKIVNSEKSFFTQVFKVPSLAKNLFISCDYDVVINISNGLSQGINRCKNTKVLTFLYDFKVYDHHNFSLIQKIFRPYLESWAIKRLQKIDRVIVAREDLKSKLFSFTHNIDVLPPPFKISDYSLFPKDMFAHNFFLIETTGLTIEMATNISDWMVEWGFEFQFIGPYEHLSELQSSAPSNRFFGNRCSGEHAPVLAASKGLISFNETGFPKLVFATMATGRPIIAGNAVKKWVDGSGTFFCSFNKNSLKLMIDELLVRDEELDGKKIRAHVMEYHDIKFKAELKRKLEQLNFTNFDLSKKEKNPCC